ncbi:MAG: TRAP transporter substrate-binding protein DctP [Myxococcales bacterium]|nr:TRAP transporter substrate-binding protein DctP [Myxococcales bacterium]MBK7198018.1 TRAP transporter substrate-binding protein DctP [Myxococcales bacterium]MBP6845897.1 TRAP transporter substrate-binding protein DctP [Kofleriaceae bacterium]
MRSLVNRLTLATAVAASLAAIAPAAADNVEIRLATLAPDGSSWMKILGKGAAEIDKKTEGRVKVKYYAGGVQGDERDVVRKINLGQLDGAAVTSVGLSMVEESIRVLELPRMFATVEELDYVADKMWPYFVKKFEAKGYKLGDRGDVGWIYLLSKSEITSVGNLKSSKVWMWGDDAIVRAMYKRLGISGVPLGVPEVEPNLTTGRIDACYGSPLAAVALQWNTKVKYMTSMPMSYGIAATVIKLDAYKKVTAEDQKLVLKISKGMQKTLRKQIRKDNESAKKQMERKGVKISATTPELLADFDKAAKDVWADLTGKVYSKAELEMVLKYRDEYRAKNPAP